MAYNCLTLSEKIAAKTRRKGACLIWTGQHDAKGYGLLRLDGKKQRAHRLVYELHYGEIADGCVILHSCDNPPCVEHTHLSAGVQRANVLDMHAKGRAPAQSGESNGNAKLTQEQVAEIRARYKRYDRLASTHSLGREYGVSHATISAIIRGVSWGNE
ncbi:MAG: hypothetical protein PVS3B2_00550 [Candidatus Dormibacteraceae bacterium]